MPAKTPGIDRAMLDALVVRHGPAVVTRVRRDLQRAMRDVRQGFLLRDDHWAYLQYGEDASQGIELFDMIKDPKQFTNLATKPELASVVSGFKEQLAAKLRAVRQNDLGLAYETAKQPRKKKK